MRPSVALRARSPAPRRAQTRYATAGPLWTAVALRQLGASDNVFDRAPMSAPVAAALLIHRTSNNDLFLEKLSQVATGSEDDLIRTHGLGRARG